MRKFIKFVLTIIFLFGNGQTASAGIITGELFGHVETKYTNMDAISSWDKIRERVREDISLMENCVSVTPDCSKVPEFLKKELLFIRDFGPNDQVMLVNEFVDRQLHYRSDLSLHSKIDHWETPITALKKGLGDCEEYAIAKFAILVALGHNPEEMRILLGLLEGSPHAMLITYVGEPTRLEYEQAIKPLDEYSVFFLPAYSFSLDSWRKYELREK